MAKKRTAKAARPTADQAAQPLCIPEVGSIRAVVQVQQIALNEWRRVAIQDQVDVWGGRKTLADAQTGVNVRLGYAREALDTIWAAMERATTAILTAGKQVKLLAEPQSEM